MSKFQRVSKPLFILLALTVLVRGIMFVSYPLSGHNDDNQAAQRFLISEVVNGNLLIGNLRYQTGYPLMIAPVVAVSRLLGPFDERFVLLVQISFYSTIPFLLYDIIRTRRSPREGFLVALIALLDPFALAMPHFWLPEWLVMTLLVMGLWLIHRALLSSHPLRWVATAGFVLGLAGVARFNFMPMVAVLGVCFFLLRSISWRQRLAMFTTLGMTSAALLVSYIVLIQIPSTGGTKLSCSLGRNLIDGMVAKHIPLEASNGPATEYILYLMTLRPLSEISFFADSYPNWRIPGSWVPEGERQAFFSQSYQRPTRYFATPFTSTLIYYLGPCEHDTLLQRVFWEGFRVYPGEWLRSEIQTIAKLLVYQPESMKRLMQLPAASGLEFATEQGLLGFYRVDDRYFTGQWVWWPGIVSYTAIFPVWNLFRFLIPAAILYGLLSREWLYRTASVLLLAYALMIATIDSPEIRTYAALYPLVSILAGALLTRIMQLFRQWWSNKARHPAIQNRA